MSFKIGTLTMKLRFMPSFEMKALYKFQNITKVTAGNYKSIIYIQFTVIIVHISNFSSKEFFYTTSERNISPRMNGKTYFNTKPLL